MGQIRVVPKQGPSRVKTGTPVGTVLAAQIAKIDDTKAAAQASAASSAASAADAAASAADAATALGATFATVDSGTATLISNPAAGPNTQAALARAYVTGRQYLSATAGGVDPDTGTIIGGLLLNDTPEDSQMAALMAVAKKRRARLVFDSPGYVTLANPLVLDYSTPGALNQMLSGIEGVGYQSGIISKVQTWGRAAVEVVGSSNITAANGLFENFRILVAAATDGAGKAAQQGVYALKVGDAKNFATHRRLWLDGPNGISLKVAGSASYAHLNTRFEQVAVQSNYNGQWWNDANDPAANNCTAYAVSCLAPDWGGAMPDTITFDQCSMSGLVEAKGFVVNVRGGDFSTNPNRPQSGGIDFGSNLLYQGGGVLNVNGAYFEDHQYGIRVTNGVASVPAVNVTGCFFTGQQNYTGPNSRRATRAIYATAFYGSANRFDSLNVTGNVFGYGGSGASTGYAQKPIIAEFVGTVNRSGNAVSAQYPRATEAALYESVS